MLTDLPYTNLENPDILLIPGGAGTRTLVQDTTFLSWLKETGQRAEIVAWFVLVQPYWQPRVSLKGAEQRATRGHSVGFLPWMMMLNGNLKPAGWRMEKYGHPRALRRVWT